MDMSLRNDEKALLHGANRREIAKNDEKNDFLIDCERGNGDSDDNNSKEEHTRMFGGEREKRKTLICSNMIITIFASML